MECLTQGSIACGVLFCHLIYYFLESFRLQMPEPQWLQLPKTPTLPKAERSGFAPINGVRIWYAIFGNGKQIIMLHGGSC